MAFIDHSANAALAIEPSTANWTHQVRHRKVLINDFMSPSAVSCWLASPHRTHKSSRVGTGTSNVVMRPNSTGMDGCEVLSVTRLNAANSNALKDKRPPALLIWRSSIETRYFTASSRSFLNLLSSAFLRSSNLI